jgi:transcriptional regulator with XRE-family HTH domain
MLEMLKLGTRHRLRELRERANVSQAELSKRTGLSCTKISLAIVSVTNERQRVVLSEARK